MPQVIKVTGEVLASNMYILFEEGTTDCWVIDIGDYKSLESKLPLSANVRGLFLTHGHFDHIADINLFHDAFPESLIYTSEYGKEQLYSDRKNFSFYHEKSVIYKGGTDSVWILRDNHQIKLFDDYIIAILETPGHCDSCLTYYTKDYLFTGDSYIPGTSVVTKLPKGNKGLATDSLAKIMSLCENRIVYPGHDVEKWIPLF